MKFGRIYIAKVRVRDCQPVAASLIAVMCYPAGKYWFHLIGRAPLYFLGVN